MPTRIDYYGENIPFYNGDGRKPYLDHYKAEVKTTDATVIIFPGGGYSNLAPHEGVDYALYLNSLGMDAFVLWYRFSPNVHPIPLLDARSAVRYLRQNAATLGIDPARIAVMGSSAGGHLAAHVSTSREEIPGESDTAFYSFSARPDLQILCYPVTDIDSHLGSYMRIAPSLDKELVASLTPAELADETTPPAFIWHTAADGGVKASSTLKYALRLQELSVPYELHIFPYGPHGLGLADKDSRLNPHVQSWTELLAKFLRLHNFIN